MKQLILIIAFILASCNAEPLLIRPPKASPLEVTNKYVNEKFVIYKQDGRGTIYESGIQFAVYDVITTNGKISHVMVYGQSYEVGPCPYRYYPTTSDRLDVYISMLPGYWITNISTNGSHYLLGNYFQALRYYYRTEIPKQVRR
jgi:hypothetical protein